jgi:hypothetical protein
VADSGELTFPQLRTARGKLVAGPELYHPFGQDDGKGAAS